MEGDHHQQYGGGKDKKSKGGKKKSKLENAPANTVRLTSCDPHYPPDVRVLNIIQEIGVKREVLLIRSRIQGNKETCWVHSTNKSIEARVKIQFDLEFCTVGYTPFRRHRKKKKKPKGAVKNFEEIRTFLKTEGVIKEEDCECAKRTNKKDPCARKIMKNEVPILKIDELVSIKKINEEDLIKLVDIGAVIVSIEATDEFKVHKGDGIFYGEKTTKKAQGDHVVLLVGYDSFNGQHFWIIQNSWSTTWGDKGFAKISRACSRVGCENQSLFSEVVYPLVSAVDGF